MRLLKAHAYGNDFLLVPEAQIAGVSDRSDLARHVCDRHRGIGADGLVVFAPEDAGARMVLFNQDGSVAEVSGNGVRCLAALVARERGLRAGATLTIRTGAGPKVLTLLDEDAQRPGLRYRFRAEMGQPHGLQRRELAVGEMMVSAVVLNVGNPQCVVLGPLTRERLERIGGSLAVHPAFPEGTNVELALVEAPNRVRILIWERGVGPTNASGTGACASAVAAAAYGGANREVDVISPGGTQHVEWTEEGIWLSGWAELVAEVEWLDPKQHPNQTPTGP
jgi:diaminopimelate epimerase